MDAITAAPHIETYIADKTRSEYQADVQLRSAVERQFEILGEALSQLARTDATAAQRVPDLPRILAFATF